MSNRMTWRHRLAARTLRRALKRLTRAMNHAVAVEYTSADRTTAPEPKKEER